MGTSDGLRARKKQRSRAALVDAALRLFAEQGYERTTVAQIAAAAELSTRTFFLHFASKDDVLFALDEERVATLLRIVAAPEPAEAPVDLLVRALTQVAAADPLHARGAEIARLRLHLLLTVPTLRGRTLHQLTEVQQELAATLHTAYPDELDAVTAAATVGALVGAIVNAAVSSLRQDPDADALGRATRRALQVAAAGLRAHDDGKTSGSAQAKRRR